MTIINALLFLLFSSLILSVVYYYFTECNFNQFQNILAKINIALLIILIPIFYIIFFKESWATILNPIYPIALFIIIGFINFIISVEKTKKIN